MSALRNLSSSATSAGFWVHAAALDRFHRRIERRARVRVALIGKNLAQRRQIVAMAQPCEIFGCDFANFGVLIGQKRANFYADRFAVGVL